MKLLIYAGAYNYWGELNPDRLFTTDGKQLGGGETSAIQTAIAMSRRGHDVTLCGNVGRPRRFFPGWGTCGDQFFVAGRIPMVNLIPDSYYYYVGCGSLHDVLIGWDSAHMYRYNVPARVRVVAYQLNDTEVGVLDHVIDRYYHPSRWHAQRFQELYGIPEKKSRSLMTNGTDLNMFPTPPENRKPYVIYCSSPDRGLHHLLDAWPEVRAAMPEAELHIYYDMTKWTQVVRQALAMGQTLNTTERALQIQKQLTELRGQGVYHHGGVAKGILYRAMAEAKVLAYPCDPVAPTEGFSMTILDGIASGLNVITTDADALPELWGSVPAVTILPLPVQKDVWATEIVNKLQGPSPLPQDSDWVKLWTWDELARKWEEDLTLLLEEKS